MCNVAIRRVHLANFLSHLADQIIAQECSALSEKTCRRRFGVQGSISTTNFDYVSEYRGHPLQETAKSLFHLPDNSYTGSPNTGQFVRYRQKSCPLQEMAKTWVCEPDVSYTRSPYSRQYVRYRRDVSYIGQKSQKLVSYIGHFLYRTMIPIPDKMRFPVTEFHLSGI